MGANRKRYVDESYLDFDANDFEFPFDFDDTNSASKKAKVTETSHQDISEQFISNASNISYTNEEEFDPSILDFPKTNETEEEFDTSILNFPTATIDDKFESNDQVDNPEGDYGYQAVIEQPETVIQQPEASQPTNQSIPSNYHYLILQGIAPEAIKAQLKSAASLQPTFYPEFNFFPAKTDVGSVYLRNGTKIDYTIKDNNSNEKIVLVSGLTELLKQNLSTYYNYRIANYGIQGVSCRMQDTNTLRIDINAGSIYQNKEAIEGLIGDLLQGRELTQGTLPVANSYSIDLDCIDGKQLQIQETNKGKEVTLKFKEQAFATQISTMIKSRFSNVSRDLFQFSTVRSKLICTINFGSRCSLKENEAILDFLKVLLNPNVLLNPKASLQDFKRLKEALTYETNGPKKKN